MRKHIPNVITLLNLFCGSIAVILTVNNHLVAAAGFVFLGIFFDFFDGFAARKLGVQSALGIQLDSLADMVTSGLVPGLVMYKLIALSTDAPVYTNIDDWEGLGQWIGFRLQPIALVGLGISLASAYRLARFNIDEDQQSYFKGLPTPANALLILSLPLILEFQDHVGMQTTISNTWFLMGLTLVSCYLLNAPFKLFSLKFKTWDFGSNSLRYSFLILSIVLLVVLQFAAIPLVILFYLILSLLSQRHIV